MRYLVKRTVIAKTRLEIGTEALAKDIGGQAQIDRLIALGAIQPVEDAASPTLPEMDDALRVAMTNAINALPADAFDQGGKPKVKALEAALPAHKDRITAAVRDLVWDEMKAAAEAASRNSRAKGSIANLTGTQVK